jgi:ssDNA-binding Zn-finger/Zn-ribbon topoisomerase 1
MMSDVRCPQCGRRTVILTSKKDDRSYYVCINRPNCRGRIPVDEVGEDGWGDDWDNEKTAVKTAPDAPRRRRETYSSESKPGKDKRRPDASVNRSERKVKASVDKDWGDDWDEGSSSSGAIHERPRSHRGVEVAHDESRHLMAFQQDAAPEGKAHPRPRQRRVPQEYLVPERKRRSLLVIIIALIIAFLAIDGMIYAAFVLR